MLIFTLHCQLVLRIFGITKYKLQAECQLPIFGAKFEPCRHKTLLIFHFLQADTVFGIVNPFP